MLVVAAGTLCALADRAPMARVGEATLKHSGTFETRVVCSIAFWAHRISPTWSLDCHPRCFTGSFRAVDSRIAANSWR